MLTVLFSIRELLFISIDCSFALPLISLLFLVSVMATIGRLNDAACAFVMACLMRYIAVYHLAVL